MNYLIIDDEPLAHRIIEKFAQELPILQKIGNAYDAFEGFDKSPKAHSLFYATETFLGKPQ